MSNLSRRNFISLSTMAGMATPLLGWSSEKNAMAGAELDISANDEEPVFRFLQVNDIHVQSDVSRYNTKIGATYSGANTRASWLLEALKNNVLFPKLDFVMAIGDMIHGEQLEGIKYDMDYFHRQFVSQFPLPLYTAVGNHENAQREGDPEYQEPYTQVFGKNRFNYSFVHKGIHFVVVNNSGTWVVKDNDIINDRVAKFRTMLNEHPELPKIVCCHVPLTPVREKEVLAKSFGFASYYTKEQEMIDIITQKQDKVLAVLSGHLHLTGVVNISGIYHISLSGLASYPHDMAVYSVYRNRVEMEVMRVPSDMLVPSTNIHGAARFGLDYTDNIHKDYTSYLMGHETERRFAVPFVKG
jgi:hypothetical protein